MRPEYITCVHCGTQAEVAGDGPIPKYCSAACRSSASYKRSRRDGRYAEALAAERQRTEQRRADSARPCPYCGDLMAHPRRKQCGAPECKRQFTNDRMREYQRRYKEKHGFYQTRLYDRGKKRQYAITCQQCGREATVTKSGARHCSHQCFYDAKYGSERPREEYAGLSKEEHRARERAKTRRRKAQRKLQQAASGSRGWGLWCSGHCARCGDYFTRRSTGEPTSFCSRKCRLRSAASLRRALQAGVSGEHVSRWRIYERDKWTCHICGDPVDRDAVVPDLAAPVLDHVIPVARGGPHTEDNLKTAHFYCNSVKRDLVDGWSAAA